MKDWGFYVMFSEPNSVSVQLIQASPFIAFYGKGGASSTKASTGLFWYKGNLPLGYYGLLFYGKGHSK